jgi:ATP-dependent Clp protease ATP-binding subunit ClpE
LACRFGDVNLVEGLAQKIVDGDVPQKLLDKEVIRLDVVSLVQGTGIRGQFEERMQKLIEEITEAEYCHHQQHQHPQFHGLHQ